MLNAKIVLGKADDGCIDLSVEALQQHLFIVGGTDQKKPKEFLVNALIMQARRDSGLLYIQYEEDRSKEQLILAIRGMHRLDNFIELRYSNINQLDELIHSAIFYKKILYVELHKTTEEFQQKMIHSLIKNGEKLYKMNSLNNHIQYDFMVAVDQIHKMMCKNWLELSLFSRRNKMSLIFTTDHIKNLTIKEQGIMYVHTSFDVLLRNFQHKIIFKQDDKVQNKIASDLFDIPEIEVSSIFFKLFSSKKKKQLLIDQLNINQFIYAQDSVVCVLDMFW